MTKNLYMEKIGEKAKIASLNLSSLSIEKRNSVLKQFIHYLKTNESLKQVIKNISQADIKDGGEGAFYVYLKKFKE